MWLATLYYTHIFRGDNRNHLFWARKIWRFTAVAVKLNSELRKSNGMNRCVVQRFEHLIGHWPLEVFLSPPPLSTFKWQINWFALLWLEDRLHMPISWCPNWNPNSSDFNWAICALHLVDSKSGITTYNLSRSNLMCVRFYLENYRFPQWCDRTCVDTDG